MLTIQIGITDKRINSTQIPSNSLWMDSKRIFSNCTFKEGTSFETPTVQIRTADDLSNCNYMTIARSNNTSKKFYWITDIRQVNNIWEITGRKDNLAQYKTEIGALEPFVERCGLNWNRDIYDDQCVLSHVEPYFKQYDAPFGINYSSDRTMWVVLQIVGVFLSNHEIRTAASTGHKYFNASDITESTFLMLPLSQLKLFMQSVEYQITSANATCDWNFSNNLLQAYLVPDTVATKLRQPINSWNGLKAWWIEGTPSGADDQVSDWMSSITADKLFYRKNAITVDSSMSIYFFKGSNANTIFYQQLSYPIHPQFSTTNYNWLNRGEGISDLRVSWGPVGGLSIPLDRVPRESLQLSLELNFSTTTNSAILLAKTLIGTESSVLSSVSVQPFFPTVAISNIIEETRESKWAQDDKIWNGVSGVVGGLTALSYGNVAGAISSMVGIRQSIVNADRTISSQTQVSSINGSYTGWALSLRQGLQVHGTTKMFKIPDRHLLGRPLYEKRQISQCGGDLIKCGTVDLHIPGVMMDEAADVISFMQGGFYFE